VAVDPDGDRLTYDWSASQGIVDGSGPTITWTAPDLPGTYPISVTVSDKDGSATGEINIKVLDQISGPPVIKEIKTFPVNREVGDDKTVTIECVAFDPDGDEINYDWNGLAGTLTGNGPIVLWKPALIAQPMVQCILIRLTDSRGDRSVGQMINFRVLAVLPCVG
jgi:phage baseplate assembly protein gpV